MQRDTQTPATGITVTCPCCHGTKRLTLHDPEQEHPTSVLCCHCIDGRVPSEDDVTVENNCQINVGASLKRNEMTKQEKREHLRGLGIKDSFDIEKIIVDVFHPQDAPT